MTDDASWYEGGREHLDTAASVPDRDRESEHPWAERFRGAILGGAVGDALGAGVRHHTIAEIQNHLGPRGVLDYLPVFGARGAGTELTQLTAFTLEALLQAKAVDRAGGEWLPTAAVRTNHLRWLHTQGVPWDYAMSAYLRAQPEPSGWLLERPELFSTRNPGGSALTGLAKLARQPSADAPYDPRYWPPVQPGFAECVVWAAPAMAWESDVVFALGAGIAQMLSDDRDVHAVAGTHADLLGRLIRGATDLWEAVSAAESRSRPSPSTAVRRLVRGARFLTRDGQYPDLGELDAEFDTTSKPGEWGIALASVAATSTFADAVLMALNHSADSSVTGALAGQLAGALYGAAGIPARWLRELELFDILDTLCSDAAEAFAPPPPPPPLPKWAQRYVADRGRAFSGPLELSAAPADDSWATVDSSVAEPYQPEPADGPSAAGFGQASSIVEAAFVLAPASDKSTEAEREIAAEADRAEPSMGDTGGIGGETLESASEPIVAPETHQAADELRSFGWDEVSTPEPSPVDSPLDQHEPASEQEIPQDNDVAAAAAEFHGTSFAPGDASLMSEPGILDVASQPPESVAMPEEPSLPDSGEMSVPDSGELSLPEPAQHLDTSDAVDQEPPSLTERVLGCFLGGALGDALGADLESMSAQEITDRLGVDGPRGLREAYGVHGAITDDTQMTLFTAEALIRGSIAQRTHGVTDPLPEIQLAYQRWLHTQGVEWEQAAGPFLASYPQPDGWLIGVQELHSTRAPGKTVLGALAAFADGAPAGAPMRRINNSKGCGAVMRAAPISLYSTDPSAVFELAARAGALTHGHPSGYLPAGALAVIVQQALLGKDLDDGVWLALQVLETWEGHEETSTMLKVAVDLAERGVPSPAQIEDTLGGGWVGDQALAIAVCAALVAADDVELALRTAVHHSGDSDSTGAICGNIVGSLVGIGGLPMDWLAELELREVIQHAALDCVAEFGVGDFFPDGSAHGRPTDEEWNRRYPARPLWTPAAQRAADPNTTGDTQEVRSEPDLAGRSQHAPAEPTAAGAISPEEPAEPARGSWSSARGEGWSSPATRVADREFYRTDPPAPRPAPRRINGVVSNYRDE